MKLVCILLASSALAQTTNPLQVPPAKAPAAQSPQSLMREALEKQKASIARQQQSVRQQAETAGVRLIPWDAAEPGCDPVAESVVAPLIDSAAAAQKLKPELIRAVIEKESAFRPCALSGKGAQGLMQLMPATSAQFGLHDVFDPKENIDAGAQFLKQLLDKYGGDLAKALGAYNAGPAAVDQTGGIPDIPETRDYVDAIMQKLDATRTAQPSTPKPKPIEN
jgi:soluble lytic murein transglycosylase-like protein